MEDGKLINNTSGRHVKALLVVHVFGNMADMVEFTRIAKEYNLILIEDATEALGTYYTSGPFAGKYAGTIGDVGVYSFNGNKLITTGSGGMVVSNHPDWAEHAKHLSTQAKADELQFLHDEVGYNYRLTNLQAALGLAQIEQVEASSPISTRCGRCTRTRWTARTATVFCPSGTTAPAPTSGSSPSIWRIPAISGIR